MPRDREAQKAYQREWYLKNRDRVLAQQREYKAENEESLREYRADWYQKNKERIRDQQKEWDASDRGRAIRLARVRARQAKVAEQTCDCCAKEEFEEMYMNARTVAMEVDHITPLSKGGLHCVKNLQLLTMDVNRRKFNRVGV